MSAFITKLWEDIFTPGPTPTILKATNASFAALQLVLALMLIATRSVHCVVLSVLCAGLWASVNWFVVELRAAQEEEAQKKQRVREVAGENKDKDKDEDADEEDEDTEEEEKTSIVGVAPTAPAPKTPAAAAPAAEADLPAITTATTTTPEPIPIPAPAALPTAALEPIDARGEVKHRPGPGTQSSVSTEDEWEKVSEHDNEHDKDK